jgi:ferrous iron transport protein A
MNLREAIEEKEYEIKAINTDDDELKAFLFSLGCYEGEKITVISNLKGSVIVSIKDGRYNLDNELAEAILI